MMSLRNGVVGFLICRVVSFRLMPPSHDRFFLVAVRFSCSRVNARRVFLAGAFTLRVFGRRKTGMPMFARESHHVEKSGTGVHLHSRFFRDDGEVPRKKQSCKTRHNAWCHVTDTLCHWRWKVKKLVENARRIGGVNVWKSKSRQFETPDTQFRCHC